MSIYSADGYPLDSLEGIIASAYREGGGTDAEKWFEFERYVEAAYDAADEIARGYAAEKLKEAEQKHAKALEEAKMEGVLYAGYLMGQQHKA